MRSRIQGFGKSLSRMVMPNIGAFIAWGFITALFISSGWWPNENLATLVDPLLKYLLPLLIAISGGRNVAGDRGGIIAAIAAMGVIVGSDIPMFIGAMVIGPLAGLLIKKVDRLTGGKIPAGFEMLVNNFSLGILGMVLAIIGYYTIGPLVDMMTRFLGEAVSFIMNRGFLPLVSLFIEPGKVLFLNNAINHGVLTPLGIEQVRQTGSSIMFLLEANPGSGLGILAAYWLFSKGAMRNTAPGAIIIHFFGGIHEIYFPYILARPALIIAPVLGSASAVLLFSLLGGGLVAPASPGSIIAVMAMSPRGKQLIILLGVLTAAIVSFLVASPIVRRAVKPEGPARDTDRESLKNSGIQQRPIRKIIFACDAGMGSSAMSATRFKNRLKSGMDILVENSPVDEIPGDADIVVCQAFLADRAARSAPAAEIVIIRDFLESKSLDHLYERLFTNSSLSDEKNPVAATGSLKEENNLVLLPENIVTGLQNETKEEAILRAGAMLEKSGYVLPGYAGSMLEREKLTTTYIGMGIAIPHGTGESKKEVLKTGITVLQYPDGVTFGDEKAFLVVGIAAAGNDHIQILANLSTALDDETLLNALFTTSDKDMIFRILGSAVHHTNN
jgi:PTS system mannitol-specific IIC component